MLQLFLQPLITYPVLFPPCAQRMPLTVGHGAQTSHGISLGPKGAPQASAFWLRGVRSRRNAPNLYVDWCFFARTSMPRPFLCRLELEFAIDMEEHHCIVLLDRGLTDTLDLRGMARGL